MEEKLKSLKREIKSNNFSFAELEELEYSVKKARVSESKQRKEKGLENLQAAAKLSDEWYENAKYLLENDGVAFHPGDELHALELLRKSKKNVKLPLLILKHAEPKVNCKVDCCAHTEYRDRYENDANYYHLLDKKFAMCQLCFENMDYNDRASVDRLLDLEASFFAQQFLARLAEKEK